MIDATRKSPQQPQSRSTKSNLFQQKLEDAIAKIQISDDFTIVHSDYEPLVFAEQYQNYLRQLAIPERSRILIHKLQGYLYDIFMDRVETSSAKPENVLLEKSESPMINQGDRWYETEFYQRLLLSNHGNGYSDPNWLVVDQQEQCWQVNKDGLTLSIDPELYLLEPAASLQLGQTISIAMPPNLIDHGFYIAVGDAGSVGDRNCSPEHTVAQLYFNVSSDTALILLDDFTKQLNSLEIPFCFKLAYQAENFPNPDSAVLEFMSRDWQQVKPIVTNLYDNNQSDFQSKVPFFCQQIGTGLGLAEKPFTLTNSKFDNLGLYYCNVIAQAIVKAINKGDLSKTEKINYILDYLSQLEVNLELLYLNKTSKASY